MITYITLDEIEAAVKPFLGKLKLIKECYNSSIRVEDTDHVYNYTVSFYEDGYIWSGILTQDLQKLVEKLIQEELIVNWNDKTNEGYFVNKNANVESLTVIAAKLNALFQETLKLRKELEEKIESVKDDLRDHERDYNHERTNNYW